MGFSYFGSGGLASDASSDRWQKIEGYFLPTSTLEGQEVT